MTNEEKKRVVTDYLAASSRYDFEAMGSHLAEDFTLWMVPSARAHGMPVPLQGREAFLDFVRALQTRPGKWKVRSSTPLRFMFGDGEETAAVHVRNIGDYSTGAVYDNEYVFLFRFAGGKIVEMREFTDTAYIASLTEQAMARAG